MKRRDFLRTAAGGAIAANMCTSEVFAQYANKRDITYEPNRPLESTGLQIRDVVKILKKGEKNNTPPVLREEILDNPDAVFIIRAGITNERDENGTWMPCNDQMERFGRRVVELVFRKGTEKRGRTFIKPNMVGHYNLKNPTFHHGWCVHPYFTAGFVDALRDIGNTNSAIGVRGGLWHETMVKMGITDIFNTHKHNLYPYQYPFIFQILFCFFN